MKTNDIKVGNDYAYAFSSYAINTRVTVLEVGVERVQGWGTTRKTVRNGVRVRYQNGSEGVVPSREIREEWAPYAERQERMDRARQERQERDRADRLERARQAKVLDDYLAGHGEEAKEVQFFERRGIADALTAAGYDVAVGSPCVVRTRISSITAFVKDGTVEVDDLRPVFADLALKAPEVV